MSEKTAKNSRLISFAILIIAFVMYGQSSTGPIIANIIADCPGYDPTLISMIQTYPTVGIVATSLAYGFLSRRFSSRTLLVAATVLYVAGGVAPAFLGTDIPAILACRIVLGLGLGIYCSLPVALIAENFQGNEGASLNGFVQVSASLGTVAFQTAAGFLAAIDWHMVMYIALISIVACVIALVLLPKNVKTTEEAAAASKVAEDEKAARAALSFSQKFPPIVICYWVEIFLFVGGIALLMMNASIVIESKGFGTAVDAATALNVHTICGIVAGIIFGAIFKRFTEYLPFAAAVFACVAYLCLGFASNLTMVVIGAGLLGFAAPWTCASLFQLIGKYAAPVAAGMACSIAVALQFGSQFLLGYWAPAACNLIGINYTNGTDPFLFYAIIFGILAVAHLIQSVSGSKNRQAALVERVDPK